jgi:glycosyltransferase involved in cell wall biosynthesis
VKILHVNAFDEGGGAARAALRLHGGLRRRGVDSEVLTVKSTSGEAGVFSPLSQRQAITTLGKRQLAMKIAALQKTPTNDVFHSLGQFSSGLGRWINASDIDIVNLHWTGAEALSIAEIAAINKPVVWTMHDMWAFMGTEHYDDLDHPGRWRAPYAATTRPAGYRGPDLDAWVWKRKAELWAGKSFHLVAPSHWLARCAQESALMGGQPCEVIANPLDTEGFAPVNRIEARRMLGLPLDRKLLLFGALGATSDRRKGYDLLVAALKLFEQRHDAGQDTEIVVFGGDRTGEIPGLGLKSHFLGTFRDEVSLRVVYSAADVFVAPSRQDNLPNTVAEAGACGLPTAAFDIGGMRDLIANGETGALAPAFDTQALADGICRLLAAPPARDAVRSGMVSKVGFDTTIPAYLSLYEQVLVQAAFQERRPRGTDEPA